MFEDHTSATEKQAARGQTSSQLRERNSLGSLVICAIIGAIVVGVAGRHIWPEALVWFGCAGFVAGLIVYEVSEQVSARRDLDVETSRLAQMAEDEKRAQEAQIAAARKRGDFDRWKKDK